MTNVVELEQPSPPRALQQVATPSYLLQLAVEQGADLDRLERLMALQERYEANEARKACVEAMAAFKSEPIEIFKRKQVGFTNREGVFVGYSHAELSDITDAIGPAMARHGLSYRWDLVQDTNSITVKCVVTHRMGHSESVSMTAPPDNSGKKNAIQQMASSVTYLQRYTLLAITGMSTKGMDDDGNGGEPEGAGDTGGGGDPQADTSRLPPYQEAAFSANLPKWRELIRAGKKTADDIIATVSSRGTLSAKQEAQIRAITKE